MAGGTAGEGKTSWLPVVVPAVFVAALVGLIVFMSANDAPDGKGDKGGKFNRGKPAGAAGVPARPRRSPIPTDLTKLSDGTSPTAPDADLKELGGEGLKYRDLKVGDGEECPAGVTPIMDYIGWLASNGSVFDSSFRDGKSPLDLSLTELIAGWQQGVPGMKVGGVRKLVIPAALGYQSQRRPGIPPNSTLVFEIELLGIQ